MAGLFDSSAEERTETASPYRREEFRRQGTVALSRELVSVAVLLGGGITLYAAGHFMFEHFKSMIEICLNFKVKEVFAKEDLLALRRLVWDAVIGMAGPVFAVTMASGIVGAAAQVGFYFTTEPLTPKWERLNIWANFTKLFSGQGGVEALKALLKMVAVSVVLGIYLKTHTEFGGMLFGKNVGEIASLTSLELLRLSLWMLGVLAVVAAGDYGYQRFQLEGQLKMTKREAKEEFKLREGDPLIKSRIRSIQRKLSSRRMMDSIPEADAVVTNPTHLAVALKYDADSMSAPKVTAKGAGVVAQKIRELARKHGVPLIENKPLARALFKELDVGDSVPRELYKAVAEVLAYVYRLRRMREAAFAAV